MSKKCSNFANFSLNNEPNDTIMAQRYQTRFDSFEGLETVVQAIEGFSQERFLASLHLNNRRTAIDKSTSSATARPTM